MNLTSDMSTLGTVEPFDVCIIGSGFAGTILGILLVQQGIRVVMLESGFSLGRWLFDNRLKQLAMYTVSGDARYRPERTKARALGGNSNFWTGRCERYHPSDLEPYYEKAEEILRVRGTTLSSYAAPRRSPFPLRPTVSIAALKSLIANAG